MEGHKGLTALLVPRPSLSRRFALSLANTASHWPQTISLSDRDKENRDVH